MLSFNARDALSAQIAGLGWRVSSARRMENLAGRIMASDAVIAVVDTRGEPDKAAAAITEITQVYEDSAIAVLALVDSGLDKAAVDQCFDAGATHFLDMANPNADMATALKFAARYTANLNGQISPQFAENLPFANWQEWHFSKNNITDYRLGPKLLEKLPDHNFTSYPVTAFYRNMTASERQRVRGAMRRLHDGASQAAVPHELNGHEVIHHLHDGGEKIYCRIEYRLNREEAEEIKGRDRLSGLRNSSAARVWIKKALDAGEKPGLIVFGLKNFKTINAAYGRSIGDQVLRVIGQRLLDETGGFSSDKCMVARIDGQNFLVASLVKQPPERFASYASQLLDNIFRNITLEGRRIHLIAKGGLAIGGQSDDEALLIRRASLALAEAMASDTIGLKVNKETQQNIALEHQLESEIVHAIEAGEIAIALQPQMRVDNGQLVGAEALARWNHPKFGLLGAAPLFSVAERAGLMPLLSAHIRKLALSVGASWPESLSFLRLSINVTAGDLAKKNFSQDVLHDAEKKGFPLTRVTLEITETELIADMQMSVRQLSNLREQGLRIAIDDFGTGYSSLAYLKDLPLDYLKIDSGLTNDISGSKKEQVVVRSIIDMARSLDLEVIAEGVETEVQLEMLAEQGCEYFQGFLRSGPLSPEEFEIFALRSN